MIRILLIHGPNLNLLGAREPGVYGSLTLDDINARMRRVAEEGAAELRTFQSNSEGAIIDAIHDARNWADGIVINPGAFGNYAYAIADAFAAVGLPTVEVHLSNVQAREEWRRKSVLGAAVTGYVGGLGWRSYLYGVQAILAIAEEKRAKDST